MLIQKDDWASIKLAQHSKDPPLPPWAGRGDIPNGSKSFLADYTQLQVNISGAIIKRVPHGVGSWRSLDRKSSKYADEEFSFYYGEWYNGLKHGHGVEINDSCIYSGNFRNGFRLGQGRIDYANGMTVISEFHSLLQHPDRESGAFHNPYLNGEANGYAEILYSDGGLYKGVVVNDSVNGVGEYESAFGEVYKGNFKDGTLHGDNGFHKNYVGEKYFGRWSRGEMNGRGSYTNERGDSYIGFWSGFLRHGRGKSYFKGLCDYRGYFTNGTNNGKGELDFTKRKKAKNKNKQNVNSNNNGENQNNTDEPNIFQKKIPEFKSRYQGYFIANNIMSGGIVMDTVFETPKSLAKRDKRALFPITSSFQKIEKIHKEYRRKIEKYADMEQYIRKEVDHKKLKIFKQQKHFTKKAIHEDEFRAYKNGRVSVREKVRRERFEKLDPSSVNSIKAISSTWKNVNLKPANHLKETFNQIKIEKQKGEKKKQKTVIPRLAFSDFEEAYEKQRLIKYDLIWNRAESVFMEKKRELAGLQT